MVIIGIVIAIIAFLIGALAGILISGNALLANLKGQHQLSKKYFSFFMLYDKWLSMKQMGRNVKEYFEINGYKRVAIYGMGQIGVRFYEELRQEGVEVLYVIDRNAPNLKFDVECLLPENELPEVDVIIVTAINNYEEIRDVVVGKVKCPVVSLNDIFLNKETA